MRSIDIGDRLLVAAELSGLDHPGWVRVELVESHPDPAGLPWNAGPGFPYRVGYVLEDPDLIHDGPRRGTVWLSAAGRDQLGAVLEVRRGTSIG